MDKKYPSSEVTDGAVMSPEPEYMQVLSPVLFCQTVQLSISTYAVLKSAFLFQRVYPTGISLNALSTLNKILWGFYSVDII